MEEGEIGYFKPAGYPLARFVILCLLHILVHLLEQLAHSLKNIIDNVGCFFNDGFVWHATFHFCSDVDDLNQEEKRQKKKGKSGFLSPLPLSDALMKFFGTGENALSRADVVKRMWDYIKQNDLQVCGSLPG